MYRREIIWAVYIYIYIYISSWLRVCSTCGRHGWGAGGAALQCPGVRCNAPGGAAMPRGVAAMVSGSWWGGAPMPRGPLQCPRGDYVRYSAAVSRSPGLWVSQSPSLLVYRGHPRSPGLLVSQPPGLLVSRSPAASIGTKTTTTPPTTTVVFSFVRFFVLLVSLFARSFLRSFTSSFLLGTALEIPLSREKSYSKKHNIP